MQAFQFSKIKNNNKTKFNDETSGQRILTNGRIAVLSPLAAARWSCYNTTTQSWIFGTMDGI